MQAGQGRGYKRGRPPPAPPGAGGVLMLCGGSAPTGPRLRDGRSVFGSSSRLHRQGPVGGGTPHSSPPPPRREGGRGMGRSPLSPTSVLSTSSAAHRDAIEAPVAVTYTSC